MSEQRLISMLELGREKNAATKCKSMTIQPRIASTCLCSVLFVIVFVILNLNNWMDGCQRKKKTQNEGKGNEPHSTTKGISSHIYMQSTTLTSTSTMQQVYTYLTIVIAIIIALLRCCSCIPLACHLIFHSTLIQYLPLLQKSIKYDKKSFGGIRLKLIGVRNSWVKVDFKRRTLEKEFILEYLS